MKKLFTLLFTCGFASAQQPTVQSYASTSPALEVSLSGLDDRYEVSDTSVSSVNLVSFATRIDFPSGTTTATVNSVSFSLIKKVAGTQVTQLSNISMNSSSWNNEGGTSSPHIFARDQSSALIAKSGVLAGNPIPNIKTLFFTNQKITLGVGPFGKMVQEGDFYKLTRSVNVSWTVSGITQTTTLTTESNVVVWFYPTNPPVTAQPVVAGENVSIMVSGVTPDSYGKSWWMETSTDLGQSDPWVTNNQGVVSGNTTITFPINGAEPRRFWRLKYVLNPSMP